MTQNTWGKKRLRGSVYDLGHLNAFPLDIVPGDANAPVLKTRVSFGLHTFTVERKPEHTPDLFIGANGDPRSFCPVRYACSLHLPKQIEKLGAQGSKVLWSHNGNFLVLDRIPAVKGDYVAVLKVEAAQTPGIDAQVFVISAHERIKPLPNLEAISFYTLIRKVAAGEPLRYKKK